MTIFGAIACGRAQCGGLRGATSPSARLAAAKACHEARDDCTSDPDSASESDCASDAASRCSTERTEESTVSVKVTKRHVASASWRLVFNTLRAVNRPKAGQGDLEAGGKASAGPGRRKSRQFTSAERAEAVAQLRALVAPGQPLAGMSPFAKAYCDEAFCRRLLRKHNNNVQRCSAKLKEALQWREKHRELILTRSCVIGSDERVIGADLHRRPVLYLCLKNQMLASAKCIDQKVVTMMQAIDNMPAGVEKTVHIWDLHGQQFRMSDLNPAPLVDMMKCLETYFVERLHELVIIGMSRMATCIKDAVWPVVPESTRRKIKFMSPEDAKTYLQRACDEEVCGRIVAAMEQNRDSRVTLEERKKGWMRVDKSGDLVPLVA